MLTNCKPYLSLIVATLGRERELELLLQSISESTLDLRFIEIILVDQNMDERCVRVTKKFERILFIKYYKVCFQGLSLARNYGRSKANGLYIGYPDDDCTYYPDTISTLITLSQANPSIDTFVGQIFDRANNKKLFKSWPEQEKNISLWNHYFYSSSITFFHKNNLNDVQFDPNLGAGSVNGSCEDPDFIRARLLNNAAVVYFPNLQVMHPAPNRHDMSLQKVYMYACGFGYYSSKSMSKEILILTLMVLTKHLLLFISRPFRENYNFFMGFYHGFCRHRSKARSPRK